MATTDPLAAVRLNHGDSRCFLTGSIRLGIALGIAILVSVPRGQSETAATPMSIAEFAQTGERKLEEGRSLLDERTLRAAKADFEECINRDGKNPRCYFDLARADSYLFKVKGSVHDHIAAERWLDSAIANIKTYISLDDRAADAHALLADLYGNKIGLGGMFAGMHYGPLANDETKRAFQLDPKSSRAYAVVGREYLYAPKMFGGDLDQAVESFRKATLFDAQGDEAFVWLAIAYRKRGDEVHVREALSEALRLNPRSIFAKRIEADAAD